MTEHSDRSHRNELFAIQFAIQNVTNIVAAILGAVVAALVAGLLGLDPGGPGTYRIILVLMAVLLGAGLATVSLLTDDRPKSHHRAPPQAGRASLRRSRPIRAGRGPSSESRSGTGRCSSSSCCPGSSSRSGPAR